jgi:hypothetical protein
MRRVGSPSSSNGSVRRLPTSWRDQNKKARKRLRAVVSRWELFTGPYSLVPPVALRSEKCGLNNREALTTT